MALASTLLQLQQCGAAARECSEALALLPAEGAAGRRAAAHMLRACAMAVRREFKVRQPVSGWLLAGQAAVRAGALAAACARRPGTCGAWVFVAGCAGLQLHTRALRCSLGRFGRGCRGGGSASQGSGPRLLPHSSCAQAAEEDLQHACGLDEAYEAEAEDVREEMRGFAAQDRAKDAQLCRRMFARR